VKLKDITVKNVRNFLEGNYKMRVQGYKHLPKHHQEQVEYRALLCADCLKAGKCKVCGCGTPGLFFAPNKVDSKKRWGKMMDATAWEVFKKSNEYRQKVLDAINRDTPNMVTDNTPKPDIPSGDVDSMVIVQPKSEEGPLQIRQVVVHSSQGSGKSGGSESGTEHGEEVSSNA